MITFRQVDKIYQRKSLSGHSLRVAFGLRRSRQTHSYEVYPAVQDLNFTIARGESVGIVGRNGAGKSTLLKLLTRVARPTRGTIEVNGVIASLLEVGAGFHHDLSGKENIYLSGAIMGMSPRTIRQKYDEIVDFAALEPVLHEPVRTYSSGMFLRLAFSVGIHLMSDILVIDEAMAVGDRLFQQKCYQKIVQFHRQGGTLILVSHDENQLRTLCQRGIVLQQGRLVQDSTMAEALELYTSLS